MELHAEGCGGYSLALSGLAPASLTAVAAVRTTVLVNRDLVN